MQTNSYRLIKWALVAGLATSFATACVVSKGDGNDDDTNLGEGGDSNVGKAGKGGGTSTAGKAGSGGTSKGGNTATAGTGTGEGGAGGGASGFVPGACDGAMLGEEIQPTVVPNCNAVATDSACIACLKLKTDTCTAYKNCFGEEPTSACAVGAKADDLGQFECVTKCFKDNVEDIANTDDLLRACTGGCINQCTIDTINDDTSVLIGAAYDPATCEAECFPF